MTDWPTAFVSVSMYLRLNMCRYEHAMFLNVSAAQQRVDLYSF